MSYCTNCGAEGTPGLAACPVCGTASAVALAATTQLPYFASEVAATGANADLAGFWWRFLGYLIDSILLGIAALFFSGLHLGFYTNVVVVTLLGFAYGTLMLGYRNGQTLGMKSVGIRIVNAEDRRAITVQQAFARTAIYSVLFFAGSLYHLHVYKHPTAEQTRKTTAHLVPYYLIRLPSTLDLLWAAWDKRNQTLHDKFAHTIAIRPPRGI